MNIILLFIILSIVNVIFSTARSIITIKANKFIASIVNAGYFAFYNIVLIYSVADFPLWQKCLITFGCNLVGVFIVKLIEEKSRNDKLWEIKFTINNSHFDWQEAHTDLETAVIPHNYLNLGKHTMFTCYSATQQESIKVKEIINKYQGKYFASESKIL